MSLCESVFDCNQKSLDQMMKMNREVQELHDETRKLALMLENNPQHGFIYYLMSEIAVIYILYLLRNHLTLRMIGRIISQVYRLYQRISFRTTPFNNRSRSTWLNEQVELGERSTVNTELTIEYGTRGEDASDVVQQITSYQESPSDNDSASKPCQPALTASFSPASGKFAQYVEKISNASQREIVIDIAELEAKEALTMESHTAAKRPSPNSDERTVSPSETARASGSIIIV